jgi:hypothetical protein
MVREKRSRRQKSKPTPESIYDSPRIQKMLAEPFGSPIDLTREEARAIIQHHLDNPPPYDPKEADRRLRELRKIRRMWGSVLRDIDG